MSNKQSSVEWLYFAMEGFIHRSCRVHFVEYFEKAKAMHKEEHRETWDECLLGSNPEKTFEDHYNETFGE